MKYRAEIDGLRAVAVIPVVLFHAGFGLVRGGFVGVDIFFVISGYLITTIIKSDLDEGRFSLVHFYERRARRILPALFFMMIVTLLLSWIWLPPAAMTEFAQSIVSVSLFSSNIFFWMESGYFDTANELKPLLHTWTLAIEEQYYIIFPIFLMMMRNVRNNVTVITVMAAFILSLGLAQWGAYAKPSATFYLLPTRAWELAIGSLVAFYLMYTNRSVSLMTSQLMSLLGSGLILFSIFAYSEETPYPSLYTLAPTLGTALVILFATPGTWVKSLLSLKGLVGIGLISYSAYLWHQPILVFARYQFALDEPSLFVMGTLGVLAFVIAYLSWRFIEKPFRTRGVFRRNQIFAMSSAGILACILIGSVGIVTKGNLNQPAFTTYQVSLLDYDSDNRSLQEASWDPLRALSGDENYRVDRNPFDETLWFDLQDERPKLLIAGNSFSKDLYNVFLFSEVSSVYQVARYGVQVGEMDETFFDSPNYQNADIVVIFSKYNEGGLDELDAVFNRMTDDGKVFAIVRSIFEFDMYLGDSLTLADRTIIENARAGVTDGAVIRDESDRLYFEEYDTRKRRSNAIYADTQIDELATHFPKLIVLDRMDYICSDEQQVCLSMDDRLNKYFYDYGHHTLEGARYFGQRIDELGWFDPVSARQVRVPAGKSSPAWGDQDLR